MSLELLVPLGLLGLLGIVALIIIYIIKPNYLTQHVPSTYVWRLSLKYKKKRLPVSRIRNIILFICQILILASIAMILSEPTLVEKEVAQSSDVIAIIDSSASMYAGTEEDTRFQRAVQSTIDLANDTFAEGGLFSVIVADDEPDYLWKSRVSRTESAELLSQLKALGEEESACFFGESDIAAAMKLSEEILDENPTASVYLYTDVTYGTGYLAQLEERGIYVVCVNEDSEWNAAILGASAEIVDTYCEVTVDVASYHLPRTLYLDLEVSGPDEDDASSQGKQPITVSSFPVFCEADKVMRVVFLYGTEDDGPPTEDDVVYCYLSANERFQTFQSINVSITGASSDSFSADDSFNIYGGQKPVLKVQYASSRKLPTSTHDTENPGPNPFVNGALAMVRNAFADLGRYDVRITEVQQGREPALEGFDFYIFEHDMPETLPTDGTVLLFDPGLGWAGAGVSVIGVNTLKSPTSFMPDTENEDHVVMRNPEGFKIVPDRISVSQYKVLSCDPSYDVLMTCNSDPVFLVRKDRENQVAVLSFSVHYASLGRENEMAYIFYNLFDYFFPALISSPSLEIGETLRLNARGDEVEASGPSGYSQTLGEFPAELSFSVPGTYTFSGKTYFGNQLVSRVYVKIPASESNIWRSEDVLPEPERRGAKGNISTDLLIYLAAALVALLFAEWWLHAHEAK